MRVGSLFAGIGGFDLAAERAGMEIVWQSEINQKASAVLDHHWPHIKNFGDIHEIADAPRVDVLTGGFPCQDYSVAGLRGGLAGDRGALWWEYHRLITRLRPTWVVAENVPGLLSSRDGADFETIVWTLVELGYGVAWAVLDAQYFGVAQRRRRVFIVGHSGGQPRPEVLALAEGLFGHPEPSRQSGEGTTTGTPFGLRDNREVSPAVTTPSGGLSAKQNQFAFVLQPDDQKHGKGAIKALPVDASSTLSATEGAKSTDRGVRIVFAQNQRDELRDLGDQAGSLSAEPGMKQQTFVAKTSFTKSNGWGVMDDGSTHTLDAAGPEAVISQSSVRRLTPLECERLQGFPDGWTDIPGNSVQQRYRQLGNAVAVPVAEWVLGRLT